MTRIRIATRESALALWQANDVRQRLLVAYPDITVELVGITTLGDKILDRPLSQIGGKGLFVKELETALLDGRADIAVHSMKDVPMELPPGFCIAAICERADPSDAFVSNRYASLEEMPAGARLGTSSLRRRLQCLQRFPNLTYLDLRGNVNTRLAKLDDNEYEGIILATAGLERLGLGDRIKTRLSVDKSIPAAGQGAVGIECQRDKHELTELLKTLNHKPTSTCVLAERGFAARMEATCTLPIAAFATLNEELQLHVFLCDADGKDQFREQMSGPAASPRQLGESLAEDLLGRGADKIMADLQ